MLARQILKCPRKGEAGSAGESARSGRMRVVLLSLTLSALFLGTCSVHLSAQTPQTSSPPPAADVNGETSQTAPTAATSGSINGTLIDKDGLLIEKAQIVLTSGSFTTQAQSGEEGGFNFTNVPPGPFELSISAPGFATQTKSGVLQAGQDYLVPVVTMVVATTFEVNVTQTREEIATEEVHVEEEQRVLGVVPNFYVTYLPDAAPLNAKQKFQLGWKFTVDPVSFLIAGVIAGAEQTNNSFSGYGQGAQGYGKRFGAAYADFVSGTFFGNMLFPAVFKQDPRYFYKGTGSRKSRLLYALANAVICKGDNRRWQPNYSNVLGSLASGGLSNLYYPASNRNGLGLTFENAAIGIAGSAGSAVIEEFFLRKLTTHTREQKPQN